MRPLPVLLLSAGLAVPACGPDPAGPPPPQISFTDATDGLAIHFSIDRAVTGDYFMPDSMGTGCALFDCDGDGDLDLYVVNGFRAAGGALVTPQGANRLYRQEDDGAFRDVSADSGADDQGYGMGVAVGDIDNDGDADLFVTNYGANALYRNDGDGTFTDVTDSAGIAGSAWSASAGFFDADGDGALDLYVTNYLEYDEDAMGRTHDAAGQPEYPSPGAFPPATDQFYRNRGDGTFEDLTVASGIASGAGRGLGVVFADLDGDGATDVYVANDGDANFAWMNDGAGGFVDRAPQMGLAVNRYGLPEASMGLALGDTEGDGTMEIFATHLVRESNTLYRPTGASTWHDATGDAGLVADSIDYTGFGTAFFDADHDGDLDLAVVNGRVLRERAHPGARLGPHWSAYAEPNQLFANDGRGGFAEIDAGAFSRDVEVSRGLAVGDLDGDGDLDLVVVNGNGTVRVYRNEGARGHWLVVRAVDPALGRDAIGAVVEVEAGGTRQRRRVDGAGSYLSYHDPRAHFGLGDARTIDGLWVQWPGGSRERFPAGPGDRVIVVRRGEGTGDDG